MIDHHTVLGILHGRPKEVIETVAALGVQMPDGNMRGLAEYVEQLEAIAKAQLPRPDVPESLMLAIQTGLQIAGDSLQIPMGVELTQPAITIGEQVLIAGWVHND